MKSLPIGEVLKEYGYINEEQLQIALDAQKKDRSKRLGEHLIDLGFVSEQQMLEALSDKLAEPLVSLDNILMLLKRFLKQWHKNIMSLVMLLMTMC